MIRFADAPPARTAIPQHRVATHDGFIWPVDRPDMDEATAIVARMGADALDLFDAAGLIEIEALVKRGWRRVQVALYADRAREQFVRLLGARNRAARGFSPASGAA